MDLLPWMGPMIGASIYSLVPKLDLASYSTLLISISIVGSASVISSFNSVSGISSINSSSSISSIEPPYTSNTLVRCW
jgi:hypothetical protein